MPPPCSSNVALPTPPRATDATPCLAPKQVDEILAAFFHLVAVDPTHLPSLADAARLPLPPPLAMKKQQTQGCVVKAHKAHHQHHHHHHHHHYQLHHTPKKVSTHSRYVRPASFPFSPYPPLQTPLPQPQLTHPPTHPTHSHAPHRPVKKSQTPPTTTSSSSSSSSSSTARLSLSSFPQAARRILLVEDDKENMHPSSS